MGLNGVLYAPLYSTLKPRGDYLDQVEWERNALINTTIIAF